MKPTHPCALIFTLGPGGERARRPLLPSRLEDDELALRAQCLLSAVDASVSAGCRVMVSCPEDARLPVDLPRLPQEGTGFGQRLMDAMARMARISSGPMVVLGSDTPGLTARHIRRALEEIRLDADAVVMGPATDGGIYLLAMGRPIGESLRHVRWCGTSARADLIRTLAAAGFRVVLLEPLGDLDSREDLESWLAARHAPEGWIPVLRRLRHSLARLHRRTDSSRAPVLRRPPRLHEGRAPPFASLTQATSAF
ncbi:MAG: TIGR04282 family arsenosugar biosynthesis glycosyltransferase [Candidatus Polarisedimenticolia bacterium]